MRERERPREAEPLPPEPVATPTTLDPLLAAGNHAVARFLARQPKPKAAPAAGRRVVVPGIGTIAIEAIQMDAGRPVAPPRGGDREKEPQPPQDVHITSRPGSHSTDLLKASTDGRVFDEIEVHLPGGDGTVVLHLTGAVVASYRPDAELESWTLNARAIEFIRTDRDEEK
jgi:hypothetical protein